jgi:hypothetical protein
MICWFENSGNDVTKNDMDVFLMSSISSSRCGVYVATGEHFRRVMALYVARNRRLIVPTNFLLHNNVYLAPKVSK